MTKSRTPIIGFETHIELGTLSKMFCACSADHFGKSPNSQTCPVCLGLPGALPVPNQKAVEWTILLGLALNCQIAHESKFDRKHYFYPDLPKGYQISQYDQPLAVNGYLDTPLGRVQIERVHLEEDTGKLQHTNLQGKPVSLVDFNRSGVPLVEIVTRPDIHSTQQALAYAKSLRQLVKSLGISDCDMEKGTLRLEANISFGLDLGYKVEIKNVNSFRFIGKSIDYELARQKRLLDQGKLPIQETRGWHEKTQTTQSQRVKETSADYRYFPEPDIPPMVLTDQQISALAKQLPELPDQIKTRWIQNHSIRPDYAVTAVASPQLSKIVEELITKQLSPKQTNQVLGLYINKNVSIETSLAQAIMQTTKSVQSINDSQLKSLIGQAIINLPKPAADYQAGKAKALSALIGRVMTLSKGRADGRKVKNLLIKALSGQIVKAKSSPKN